MAQSSWTTDQGRPDTIEARFWKRRSLSGIAQLSSNALVCSRRTTNAAEGSICWTSTTDTPEDDEDMWKNAPWNMQTDSVETQAQGTAASKGNDFSQKTKFESSQKQQPHVLPAHTWRIHQKQDQTGAQTTQRWKSSVRWRLARNALQETCRDLYAFCHQCGQKRSQGSFLNVKFPREERKQFDAAKQKEIKNYVV